MSNMILEKVEIFEGLSHLELEALSNSSIMRNYPKNTVIINENDNADSLYVIESGKVKVYCSDKNGKEFIMNTLTDGDYFGELALLDDDKRSASVRTMEKANFCIIYKEDFNKVLEQHPNIAKTLIRNLTRRVRKLTQDVKALALQDVYGRVTNVLTVMSEDRGDGTSLIPDKLTQQDIAAMGRQAIGAKIGHVMERARENYGYLYDSYPMIEAYTSGWDAGHPIHQLTEFINSPEFLELGKTVTGAPLVTKADAQATRYARGHFLTRHIDEGHDKERVAAYTLGFTRNWQPDWGGLLMLLDDNLDISRAFLPRFNVLSIFDGRRIHSVSAVSPFAGGARHQITGWFRNDPPYRTT